MDCGKSISEQLAEIRKLNIVIMILLITTIGTCLSCIFFLKQELVKTRTVLESVGEILSDSR